MRAPLSWLREYVSLPESVTPQELSDVFVQLGFEVEGVHIPEPTTGPLLVGKVLSIEELTEFKKPIRFCLVDLGPRNGPDGSDEPRGIICGATNFVVGDLVVVAPPGTVLPGGFTIGSRKTYGRLSDGMICSVRELDTGTDHDGILVLGHEQVPGVAIGDDARELAGINDVVFELSINPDRGYAMSIRGLARELAAGFADQGAVFTDPAQAAGQIEVPAEGDAPAVRIDDPAGCARFVAVRASQVDPQAPSPLFIRRRLTACGIRTISLAVDVTNYVMLELGQPLHAYDAAALQGPIVVRRASAGEQVRTLDGTDRLLAGDEVLITDDSGPIGLAGVMGGESTEITEGTSEVVIEAAAFDAPSISRAARRHKLPSEAAKRFERGVDPQVARPAALLAAALMAKFGGGRISAPVTDVGEPIPPAAIMLPLGEPERLVGRPYSEAEIVRSLALIGAQVEQAGESLRVIPPSWRPDLSRPADVVEEVARLGSYDTIPSVLPTAPAGRGRTVRQRRAVQIRQELVGMGLVETLTFPFVGTADLDALGLPAEDIYRRTVRLSNPLDAERPFLRTSLVPGLLDALSRNISRGQRQLALFEIGQVFLPGFNPPLVPDLPVDRRPTENELAVLDAALPDQPVRVAAVLAGDWDTRGWWGSGRPADWADAIEIARRIVVASGRSVRVVAAERMPYHPGRCAEIKLGDWPIGFAGELHPAVIERLGLPPRTVALEVTLDSIPDPEPPVAPEVSNYPPMLADVALNVPDGTRAADVADALLAGGGDLLESLELFDRYTGEQVGEGHYSLTFALTLRAPDRTLTAEEAAEVVAAAVRSAEQRCGAKLRGADSPSGARLRGVDSGGGALDE